MRRFVTLSITEGRRNVMLLFLLVDNFICVTIGLTICCLALYIKLAIESQISFLGSYYNQNAIPGVLGFTGLAMIIGSIFGIRICFQARRIDDNLNDDEIAEDPSTPDKRFVVYVILCVAILVSLIATGITFQVQIKSLEKAFGKGLTDAMTRYKAEINSKRELDRLQLTYRCCGVKGYEDWFKVQWLDDKFINKTRIDENKKRKDGTFFLDDVPFSCCDINSVNPCISEQVLDRKVHYKYDYTVNLTLYTTGCAGYLSKHYGGIVLRGCDIFILVIFIIQIITTVVTRFLQTSFVSCSKGEDPTVGWLFSWKPFSKPSQAEDYSEEREPLLSENEDDEEDQ